MNDNNGDHKEQNPKTNTQPNEQTPKATQTSQTPPTPPAQPAQPSKAASAPQPQTPAQPKAAESPKPSTDASEAESAPLKFTTQNINNWRSRQDDPFAEQNRAAAAKKQQQAKTRRIVIPIAVTVASLLLVGGLTWLTVSLLNRPAEPEKPAAPTISSGTPEGIYDYRDKLNQIYQDSGNNMDAVNEAIDQTLAEGGEEAGDAVRLAQINLLMNKSQYESAVEIGRQINPDNLDLDQKIIYYNIMSNSAAQIQGLEDETFHYQQLLIEYSIQQNRQERGE